MCRFFSFPWGVLRTNGQDRQTEKGLEPHQRIDPKTRHARRSGGFWARREEFASLWPLQEPQGRETLGRTGWNFLGPRMENPNITGGLKVDELCLFWGS